MHGQMAEVPTHAAGLPEMDVVYADGDTCSSSALASLRCMGSRIHSRAVLGPWR